MSRGRRGSARQIPIRLTCALWVAAWVSGVGPASASAQAPTDTEEASASEDDGRARELYLRGDRYYSEGRYEEAVEAFTESYRLSGRLLLQFNLANAYERLGRYEEALVALRRYAPSVPVAEEDQIRRRIENLAQRAEAQREQDRPAQPVPPPPVAEPEETPEPAEDANDSLPPAAGGPDIGLAAGGATALAVGALLAAGGGAFGAMALDAGQRAAASCAPSGRGLLCTADAETALNDEATYALLADIGLVVGGGVFVAGVALLILGLTANEETERASIVPWMRAGADGVEVGVAGSL